MDWYALVMAASLLWKNGGTAIMTGKLQLPNNWMSVFAGQDKIMNEGLVQQVAIKLWLDFFEVLDGISLARGIQINFMYVPVHLNVLL